MALSLKFTGGQQHPLENSVIVKHIFDFVAPTATLDLLKKWRLVSHTWHDESLNFWRRTAVLNVLEGDIRLPGAKGLSMADYLSELERSDSPYQLAEKPFHKYNLPILTIDCGRNVEEGDSIDKVFWNEVGPHMRRLTLHTIILKEDRAWRQIEAAQLHMYLKQSAIMVQWLGRVPNLETLMLHCAIVYIELDPSDEDVLPEEEKPDVLPPKHPNLKELSLNAYFPFELNYFPNLEKLTVYGAAVQWDRRLAPVPAIAGDEAPRFEHLSLKYVDLMTCQVVTSAHNIHLPALEHLAVSLDSLYAYSEERGVRQPDIRHLIDLVHENAGKLKTLIFLNNVRAYADERLFSVAMPRLTKLKLCGKIVRDLNFLGLMPNLELLQLDNDTAYYYMMRDVFRRKVGRFLPQRTRDPVGGTLETGVVPGEVLQKLETLSFNFAVGPAGVRLLGKWMPNLKKVEGVFDVDGLAEAVQVWKKMEELWLYAIPLEEAYILERGLPAFIPPHVFVRAGSLFVRQRMLGCWLSPKAGIEW